MEDVNTPHGFLFLLLNYSRTSRLGHLYVSDSFQCPDKIILYWPLKYASMICTLSNMDKGHLQNSERRFQNCALRYNFLHAALRCSSFRGWSKVRVDTSLIRTLRSVPSVSVLERCDCNGFDSKKSISRNLTYFLTFKATELKQYCKKSLQNAKTS